MTAILGKPATLNTPILHRPANGLVINSRSPLNEPNTTTKTGIKIRTENSVNPKALPTL